MRLIKSTEYRKMPWKNGLGETAEIDREPAGGSYLWRLSQATIASNSPFSSFPGYDRWIAIWKGDGLFLNEDRLTPLQPFRFSGDVPVHCTLIGGEVIDVGLIFDRARVDAKMEIIRGTWASPPRTKSQCVHYLFDIEAGDTIKIERPTKLEVGPSLLISLWWI